MEQSYKEIESIQKLRESQCQSLFDWKQEAIYFVAPQASQFAFSQDEFPLEEDIENFLLGDKKVMLLLGDSGSGKSLFTQRLVAQKWQIYQPKKNHSSLDFSAKS